jgi:hypothetical protein
LKLFQRHFRFTPIAENCQETFCEFGAFSLNVFCQINANHSTQKRGSMRSRLDANQTAAIIEAEIDGRTIRDGVDRAVKAVFMSFDFMLHLLIDSNAYVEPFVGSDSTLLEVEERYPHVQFWRTTLARLDTRSGRSLHQVAIT